MDIFRKSPPLPIPERGGATSLKPLLDEMFQKDPRMRHLMELRMRTWEGSDSQDLSTHYIQTLVAELYEHSRHPEKTFSFFTVARATNVRLKPLPTT